MITEGIINVGELELSRKSYDGGSLDIAYNGELASLVEENGYEPEVKTIEQND